MTSAAELRPPPNPALEPWRRYLARLAAKGGPGESDHTGLDGWFGTLADARRSGKLSDLDLQLLLAEGGDATSSLLTLQGFARLKPHGYAGDFELIDRILTGWSSSEPERRAWDRYFLSRPGIRALSYDGEVFLAWASQADATTPGRIRLLYLGGGPARDLAAGCRAGAGGKIAATYMDPDPAALSYARRMCGSAAGGVTFIGDNPLRCSAAGPKPERVWLGSMLDSLDDAGAASLLARMRGLVRPGGQILGANFSPGCPTLCYMEVLGWPVHARSARQLTELAERAGFPAGCRRVEMDPTGGRGYLYLVRP